MEARKAIDLYVARDHTYVVSVSHSGIPGGLTVFDVRDRAAPVLKNILRFPGDGTWNAVWAKGNALYVASAVNGVLVFDISEPAEPRFVTSVPVASPSVHTVFVEGNRLYAMETFPSPRVHIFDVSAPTVPVWLGAYSNPDVGWNLAGAPHDAFALEGRLYINHWALGYVIADVSNPANVVKLGEYRLEPQVSIRNMVLKGKRLYLAHHHHGVRVLNVSEPEQPRELAYFNTYQETAPSRGSSFYDGAIGIRLPEDGYLYTVDTTRGLLIFPEPRGRRGKPLGGPTRRCLRGGGRSISGPSLPPAGGGRAWPPGGPAPRAEGNACG